MHLNPVNQYFLHISKSTHKMVSFTKHNSSIAFICNTKLWLCTIWIHISSFLFHLKSVINRDHGACWELTKLWIEVDWHCCCFLIWQECSTWSIMTFWPSASPMSGVCIIMAFLISPWPETEAGAWERVVPSTFNWLWYVTGSNPFLDVV